MAIGQAREYSRRDDIPSVFENFIRNHELLTVNELAVVLKVSPKTIRHWVLQDRIPVVRPRPRMVRFDPLVIARRMAERNRLP